MKGSEGRSSRTPKEPNSISARYKKDSKKHNAAYRAQKAEAIAIHSYHFNPGYPLPKPLLPGFHAAFLSLTVKK